MKVIDVIEFLALNERMSQFQLPFKVTSRLLYTVMLVLAGGFTLVAIVIAVFTLPVSPQVLQEISTWVFVIVAGLFFYNRKIQKAEASKKAEEEASLAKEIVNEDSSKSEVSSSDPADGKSRS